jgi:adenosylhomocysteinase
MNDIDKRRAAAYFQEIAAAVGSSPRPHALVISHVVAGRSLFIGGVARLATVAAVLPKPKSIDKTALREISCDFPCDELDRRRLADPNQAMNYVEHRATGRSLVLLDVGGYFAPALKAIRAEFSGRLLGVIEDTENGLRRYLDLGELPCPVYSVARSPLKEPEDYLVGQSVVFSVEALLRDCGNILHGRRASVIGFGKVGASVASMLRARHVQVRVFDIDPVRTLQALARGFPTASTRSDALAHADVVIAATGNLALRSADFALLSNGAYLASVTSSDDELELTSLDGRYDRQQVGPHVTKYSDHRHHFYVLNDGNAVNFLHGASVGPFIYLVQGEILAALGCLAGEQHEPGLYEVADDTRRLIAKTWMRYFNGTHSGDHMPDS